MFNHPFSVKTDNYTTEKTANSQQTNILGHNVILSQEQQRNIHDSTTTTISGLPQFYSNYSNNGVVFTFNNNCNQPAAAAVHQNIWSNNFEKLLNKQSNDIMQLQQFIKNDTYMLRFHADHQTSTTDLSAQTSHGTDLRNLAGLFERLPDWVRISPTYQNYRKLILKNPKIAKLETSIVDDLIKEDKDKEKKDTKKDADIQTNLCCCDDDDDCDKDDEKNRRKTRKKEKSVRLPKETPSNSDVSDDDHRQM